MNEIEEIFPEPLPVVIHEKLVCPNHAFKLISFPRDKDADSGGYQYKCPLRNCNFGI